MNQKQIKKIFKDTAYVRMGGTDAELRAAEYIKETLEGYGLKPFIDPFEVQMGTVNEAILTVDGKDIPCKGYMCAGSGEIEAPFYYLSDTSKVSLAACKGKIVMIDGYLGHWKYKDLLENGALGFITYDGSVNYADRNIDARELRAHVAEGNKILGVNINVKDAVELIRGNASHARIKLSQDEYTGESRNVVVDIPGERESTIVLTAHYDSTSLSEGAYDNMSGCVGLLAMAEYFSKAKHLSTLRFVFCGSEERGLLGSKAYCEKYKDELEKTDLCVNIDMIGCVMGKLMACCTSEEKLCSYISYMGLELGTPVSAYKDVYSSDSTPFADKGVPAVSFARFSPREAATIHNSYDTQKLIKPENMQKDISVIQAFTERMANAAYCPVAREIPDDIKKKLDEYLCRTRKK